MAKKNNLKGYFYLLGMALVVLGCFLPLVSSKLGNSVSAFKIITNGSGDGVVRLSSILAFAGAAAGVVLTFVKVAHGKMLKFVALIVSILGGAYTIISYLNQSGAAKGLMKGIAKMTGATPGIGLILICIGWVIALIGFFSSRD